MDLSRFYFRRTLRIFPPFYAFCVIMALLSCIGAVALFPGDLVHAMTYTMNFHGRRSWTLAHAWSLTIEEQFYVLWPALLLALNRRTAGYVAAIAVLLGPAAHFTAYRLHTGAEREWAGFSFLNNADFIAAGAALACFGSALHRRAWYVGALESRYFVLVPLLSFVAWSGGGGRWHGTSVTMTFAAIGIAACVDRSTRYPRDWTGRQLNSAPVVWLGQLSYSIYLWQQVFIGTGSSSRGWLAATAIARVPLNLAAMLSAALFSFVVVERPSLALRRRLERRWFRSGGRLGVTAGDTAHRVSQDADRWLQPRTVAQDAARQSRA